VSAAPALAVRSEIHRRLLGEPAGAPVGDRVELRRRLALLLGECAPLLPPAEADALLDDLVRDVDGLGPFEVLLADDTVTEIMVNGGGRAYVERRGRIEPVELGLDDAGALRIVERVIAPLGLRLDRASPMVDARLADGSRVHAVVPPLAPDGPCVTIRKFGTTTFSLADFGVDGPAADLCHTIVGAGWNVVVAGGTSTGKTSLLNTLAAAVDPAERIVTIEETAELRLPQPHVVRLEARPANAEGAGEVTVRDLVRTALRMRPDRLVVGEVRGGEALDMLQALNTGHDGSLSTVHANGGDAPLRRLETLALLAGVPLPLAAVRAQVAGAVDAVVSVTRGHGGRWVTAIAEVASDGDDLRLRPLVVRRGGCLVAAEAPTRPPRRDTAVVPAEAWSRC
jgi:pilus assembly protein CpaF